MNIILCEDDLAQREKIKKCIKDYILIENLDCTVTLETHDPNEVINFIKGKKCTNLYFLDINLNADINGINLATEIREHDPRGFIVFVTTHIEMSYLAFLYKVEAMDFIIKDNIGEMAQRVRDCIDKAIVRYGNKEGKNCNEVYTVRIGDRIENIPYSDILFFETSSTVHKINLYCKNRVIEFYGQIKEIEEVLDERFIRCHRAYLINKNNISKIDKTNKLVIMINGQTCYVSGRKLSLLTGA